MAQRRKVQFLLRRSSPIIKIVASAAIVFTMVALVALSIVRSSIQGETDAMREEAARLEQENGDLQDKIDSLGSVQSVQQIAEEELDLVDPDTVIIDAD